MAAPRSNSTDAALNACGDCGRSLVEVCQTATGDWLCLGCYGLRGVEGSDISPSFVTAPSPVDVPVPVPYLEDDRADLDVLLDTENADVQHVEPLELPQRATESMHRVLDDLAFCSGLLLAAGDDGTVIYAVDWAAKRLGLTGKTVSIALRRLRKCGAIRLVKVLTPVVQGRAGARVYAVVPGRPNLQVLEGGAE